MKEEEKLIEKWLDHALTDAELDSLENSSEFASYRKIDALAKQYKAPTFNASESLTGIISQRKQITKRLTFYKYTASIAAVLIIALGIFTLINQNDTNTHYAVNGFKQNLLLPDTSEVVLNAGSQLSFDENDWENNRSIDLDGEAYFKVEKGNTFTVSSSQGKVTVLGTQFTVKDRKNYFEVICYEGLVSVTTNSKNYTLPAGNSIIIIDDKLIKNSVLATAPSWISEISIFKSTSLLYVIEELERQYDVSVNTNGIDTSAVFTGSFSHKDLNAALQSITKPMALTFEVDDKNVTLKQ